MKKTQSRLAGRGATGSEWRIATPICAPSRSEMQSGRYYPNVMNDEPTPAWTVYEITVFCAPFYTETRVFAKTGSGQT
jgi:hypothetical protein